MNLKIMIPALLGLWIAPLLAGDSRTVEMRVDGLVCAFCAQNVEKHLREHPAVDDVFVSLERKVVAVSLRDDQVISDETLDKVLTNAGYTLREVTRSDRSLDEIRKEEKP